jgi:hypothetical protein
LKESIMQSATETPVDTCVPGSELALPPAAPGDADVDIEILKTVPKQFAIVDEDTANWLVRKINSARAYAASVKDFAERELRRAAREEQTLFFLFGRQIEAWARHEIEKLNGRRKSVSLPGGCIGFRKLAAKLVIDDEKVVLSWAKQNCPNAVVVTERLSKSALDDLVETTGVIPDGGAHVEPESERFYIK